MLDSNLRVAWRLTSPGRSAAAFTNGNIIIGGIDLNKARMRRVVEAVIALSPSPDGFTASDVAARVAALGNDRHAPFAARTQPKTDRCPLRHPATCTASFTNSATKFWRDFAPKGLIRIERVGKLYRWYGMSNNSVNAVSRQTWKSYIASL